MKNALSEVFVLKECTLGKAKHIIQSVIINREVLPQEPYSVFSFHHKNIDMGLDDSKGPLG